MLVKTITNKLAVYSTLDTLLRNQIFVDIFEIEGFECAGLQKRLLNAHFVERFKATTLEKRY